MPTWTENNDVIAGTAGNDVIDALGGDDLIFASGGIDQINGGSGSDQIVVAPGLLPTATGPRTYTLTSSSLTDSSGALNTSLTSIERFQINTSGGGNFNDTIDASGFATAGFGLVGSFQLGNGNNTVIGSNGGEVFFLGMGSNSINGGGGSDLAVQWLDSGTAATLYITNSGGTVSTTQGAIQNSFTSVEQLNLETSGYASGVTATIDASACVTGMHLAFNDHNGSDVFIGSSGINMFVNRSANQAGSDVFTGNGGTDYFTYTFGVGGMNGDVITDLSAEDVIDLRYNNPTQNEGSYLAYLFIGNDAFTGVAGQYRYEAVGGQTLLQVDSNGDGIADQVLTIANGEFALGETVYGPNVLQITGPAAPADEPAVAQDDAFTTNELTAANGNLFADNGSGADSDVDGPALAIAAVNGSGANVGNQIMLASGALLTVNADGTFAYDPNGAFEQTPTSASGASNTPASDSFTYTLAGGDTATVHLTINGVDNDDLLVGTGGNDVLTGGAGNDAHYGGAGDDLIRGRSGDDLIDGGDGYDRAGYYHTNEAAGGVTVNLNIVGPQDTGSQGWDTLTSIEYVSGTPFADTLTGDANDNILWGSPATIDPDTNWVSTSNNDTLDGGGGNDLLYVGIGNHSLTGGDDIDTVGFTENWGDDPAIRVSLALQGVAQDTGQGLWTLNGIENLSGGDDNDELTGDGNANILAGSAGNDMLSGGGGNDSLYGDGAFDSAAPSSGPPTLFPDVGANGDDTLEGGLGDDELYGGGGVDTASYEHALGAVQVVLYKNGGGNGDSTGADGEDLLSGIENLTGSAFNDQLAGNNLDNVIAGGDGLDGLRGNAGNDTLLGGAGDDFLNAGLGDDIIDGGAGFDRAAFYEDASPSGVTVDLNLQGVAQDTGQGMDTLIGIENVSGSRYGDTLIGDDGDNWLWGSAATLNGVVSADNNDTLTGNGGNDLLIAGIGNHTIDGGTGIDTFRFTENGAPETGITLSLLLQGQAQASGNGIWTLTNIENLSGSIAGDTLTGDANANVLAGDLGNDMLSGGAGNDILYGDGQISWDGHGTGGSGPITTFTDATGLYAGGVPGNDILEGGLGDDLIDGGGGIDTASYEHALGAVQVVLYANGDGNGDSTGADGEDLLSGIENLTGSAFNDLLVGNNLANILTGGDGHDSLRGNGGDDSLYGGAGDDLLYGNAGNDYMDGGDGFDRVGFFSGATTGVHVDLTIQGIAQDTGQGMDTLVNIEHATGTAFSDTLIGNDDHNWLGGQSDGAADTISGNGGDDLITNGYGDHVLDGGAGIDFYSFSSQLAISGLAISLALQGSAQNTGAGNMTLTNIEGLSGSTANDTLTGDANGNYLLGNYGNDTLIGGGGNDTLLGDGVIAPDTHGAGGSGPILLTLDAVAAFGGVSGDDLLEGGTGFDYINGGGGIDTASYEHAAGAVQVALNNNMTGNGSANGADGLDSLVSIENIIGSAFNDTITGSAASNVLTGGGGNDFLQARGGDDTVYGGDGNDYLGGGTGNDLLDGGAGYDRASFSNGSTGPVNVDLRIQGVAQNTGLGLDTLIGIENVTGTAFADTLIGDGGANWLWGATDAAGIGDTIDGQGGDDLIETGVGDHVLSGGDGIDTFLFNPFTVPTNATISLALQGAAQDTGAGMMTLSGFENLSGSSFADTLIGDSNDNVLAGGEVGDTLIGGAGNDTLYGDGLIGTQGSPSGPITTYADVGTLGGVDGDDTLEGGLGNDTLDGGGGIDTASYAHATGAVTVNLGTGTATGADGDDMLANIENLTGGAFNDSLTGNGQANVLDAGDGHDKLFGGGGNDSLSSGQGDDALAGGDGDDLIDGGAGYDIAAFFGAAAGVTVNLSVQGVAQNTGQGMDTLVGIEYLIGTQFADTLTGDAGDNWIWGFATSTIPGTVNNNDTIDGGDGNDLIWAGNGNQTLIGGNGVDTAVYNENFVSDQSVTLSLALQGIAQDTGQGMWTLTGFENLGGGAANDSLTGDDNANILAGGGGSDSLTGGDGDDALYGDGEISVDTHGTGISGPIILIPDAVPVFGGVSGNDTMEGGLGDDTLDGGGGNDTASYAHASGAVTVTLTAAGGSSSGADGNDTLANIENVTGGAFNDTLTGNAVNNLLVGGAGNDSLNGGGGDDTLVGGTGNDALNGGAGVDTIDYSASSAGVSVNLSSGKGTGGDASGDTVSNVENIIGSSFADKLIGNTASNTLNGGAGNDTVTGGAGADFLSGGSGSDAFVFNAVADFGSVGNSDRIMDFEAGGSTAATRVDIIDLSAIDANSKTASKDDAFTFIGAAQFSGKAGQLRYDAGTSTLSGDVNGDGIADFSLSITLLGTLDSSDFVL